MNHERLIKRSTIIERRLAGNIFSTVAIDKDENLIGCGCKKLYSFAQKGYVSLSAGTVDIMAVTNNASREYKSLTSFDYELMPYYVFEYGSNSHIAGYNVKRIVYEGMVVGTVYLDGTVSVGGLCEADEDDASDWTNIEDILIFEDGVLGVTKDGHIKLCGRGARPYFEMTQWSNVALVKQINDGIAGLSYDGFVGLKKDGTLLYLGKDRAFAERIATYKDVVSFDGYSSNGKIQDFYAILSDGSMQWYHLGSDMIPTFDKKSSKKDYLAVKYLPSGAHFIKCDGTIEVHTQKITYPKDIKDALLTLTGQKYDVVFDAMNNAEKNPLAEQVSMWKLFDDPDEVLRRYEGYEDKSFKNGNKCLYCGGELKGLFGKKCTTCGKKASF